MPFYSASSVTPNEFQALSASFYYYRLVEILHFKKENIFNKTGSMFGLILVVRDAT